MRMCQLDRFAKQRLFRLFTENIIYFPFDEIAYNTDPNGEKKGTVRGNTSCVTRWHVLTMLELLMEHAILKLEYALRILMVENYCRQCKDGKFKSLSQIRLDNAKDCRKKLSNFN